ncbi:MAG: hypothetical protein V4574_17635 [Pseudomonadota bacterium]
MPAPSRRTLLTAAAAALAASGPALAAGRQREDGGGALVFASRAAAARAVIPAGVDALWCGGFARAGDRGEALYVRVGEEPPHAGRFRSADGAWWELGENSLNPFMFGAKADKHVDDAAPIQAMFDFVAAKRFAYPIAFLGARFMVAKGLILPTVPAFVTLDIDGGGAILLTDAPVAIFSRIPKSQAEASVTIGQSHYDIHHFEFRGTGREGQVGVHIGAAYANVVRNCAFTALEYGSIGTFCLGSAWRDNLYHHCSARALTIQTGTGYDQGPVWPGATEPNSPCHVNVIENCRVFGHPQQKSAFGIFGCDGARVNGCISEGAGAGVDLHFDYQGSPTVKVFHVDTFHCEAPNGTLNFKVRASGNVCIERPIRSNPAALYDAQGSVNCEVLIKGLTWLGEMPEATGKGVNPHGRWFYHANGNGHGAKAEGSKSSGVGFRFEECVESAWEAISDPKRWEGGVLPYMLHVRGLRRANDGMMEWSTAPIQFASPIAFADNSTLSGMKTGTVAATTRSVPARSSVTERFAVAGLLADKHSVVLNPANGSAVPAPGIAWNAWIEADGVLKLRLTNVTDGAIALEPGAQWAYCAPRRA